MFVKNREDELEKISYPDYWNHRPGSENPADILSRCENLTRLKDLELWWFGPHHWLRKCKNQWPQTKDDVVHETDLDDKEYKAMALALLIITKLETLLGIRRCRQLRKILRITAWIRKFVHNARNRVTKLVQC